MAACARPIQQPDGTLLLALDPSATDLSTCAYVVSSGAEVANSLFSLTAADGAYISAAIVGTWACAFGIRAVINILKGSSE